MEVAGLRTQHGRRQRSRDGRPGMVASDRSTYGICSRARIAACDHGAFKRVASREPTSRDAWDAEHVEYSCGGPGAWPPGAGQWTGHATPSHALSRRSHRRRAAGASGGYSPPLPVAPAAYGWGKEVQVLPPARPSARRTTLRETSTSNRQSLEVSSSPLREEWRWPIRASAPVAPILVDLPSSSSRLRYWRCTTPTASTACLNSPR